MSNILHSSATDQWGTPEYIIDLVVKTFGKQVDLDPCSSELANSTVKAKRFISEEENGLTTQWTDKPVSIFINPPSGKTVGGSKYKLFWQNLINYWEESLVEQALWLGFSVEQLAILQDCSYSPLHFSFCIPRNRIKFVNLLNSTKHSSPTHSNYICYFNGTVDNKHLFYKNFSSIGQVVLN